MTGTEIFKKALILLGYTDSLGEVSAGNRLLVRALTVVNTVYADLFYITRGEGFAPLRSLSERILLPERALYDVMPYGVAAQLAQSESDGDSQQLFVLLYNQKRTALTGGGRIADSIPGPA